VIFRRFVGNSYLQFMSKRHRTSRTLDLLWLTVG